MSWISFSAFLIPFMIIVNIAIEAKGFMVVFPLLLLLLAVGLLTQRYVVGRIWHSIMWGDRD
jgi:hypothetical protein